MRSDHMIRLYNHMIRSLFLILLLATVIIVTMVHVTSNQVRSQGDEGPEPPKFLRVTKKLSHFNISFKKITCNKIFHYLTLNMSLLWEEYSQ